jgi:energy-converting hydrogenase Eha subunit A
MRDDLRVSWLGEILWSVWAGLSTAGSVLFVLAAGLTLFALVIGLPSMLRERGRRQRTERALVRLSPALREEVLAWSRGLGGYPAAEAILAAAPGLRRSLSGLGVPPEDLIDRLLVTEAPLEEEPADLRNDA